MRTSDAAAAVMTAYPRIWFACHRRHVRDPESGTLLSAHQASILDHLDTVEATSLTALARHLGVTPGTMSVAVDRLQKHGYVDRTWDHRDRRRVQLRLTEAGARVRSANSALDPALVEALLARLTAEEQRAAISGLTILARSADSVGEAKRRRA
ncbi:MAG TPA: MarR family transcriptional regulator [Gemmatimonadaceae bacterium]|jgi:DNA-binding MarR family transcriptional regulator|nr:MarR family transcriptional regulator [Gemmatimonadaceae bacterium]